MSLTAEAPVCLRVEGIDDNNGGVSRVRRSKGLSDNDGGVGRGQGIRNASNGLETMREVAGSRQQARVIHNNDEGTRGKIWAQRLQQWQQMRQCRIDDESKESKTTMEAETDQRRAWWIGNDNRVLIFLAFRLLTVKIYCLCLVAVSFWCCFRQIPFFWSAAWNTISTAIIRKIFLYQMYTNLACVPPRYRRVKKLQVIVINKDVRKSLECKKGNENSIWSWYDSVTALLMPRNWASSSSSSLTIFWWRPFRLQPNSADSINVYWWGNLTSASPTAGLTVTRMKPLKTSYIH